MGCFVPQSKEGRSNPSVFSSRFLVGRVPCTDRRSSTAMNNTFNAPAGAGGGGGGGGGDGGGGTKGSVPEVHPLALWPINGLGSKAFSMR